MNPGLALNLCIGFYDCLRLLPARHLDISSLSLALIDPVVSCLAFTCLALPMSIQTAIVSFVAETKI